MKRSWSERIRKRRWMNDEWTDGWMDRRMRVQERIRTEGKKRKDTNRKKWWRRKRTNCKKKGKRRRTMGNKTKQESVGGGWRSTSADQEEEEEKEEGGGKWDWKQVVMIWRRSRTRQQATKAAEGEFVNEMSSQFERNRKRLKRATRLEEVVGEQAQESLTSEESKCTR